MKVTICPWARWLLPLLLACSCVRAAVVSTLDGKSYEGEVALQPGNTVSVTLKDARKETIPLNRVKVATFSTPQLSMANFGHIAVGWTNVDIGEVSIPGVAGQSNRLFAVQVASADIGGQSDSLHYVYFRAQGEADIAARIVSITGSDRLARAGVIIRDSLRPEAKFVFASVNAAGELTLQQRQETGRKAATAPATVNASLPCWLKISRREKGFAAFRSTDGKDWEQLGSGPINVKESFYMGLAVTSHSGLSFCTAMFDEVSRTIPGVRAEYFADGGFANLLTNRIDPTVNFQWGADPVPVEGLPPNNFSVRWTGELEPKYSENYTFYYDGDDARLWVNDQLLPHVLLKRDARGPQGNPPMPLLLKAGNRYPFRFEYQNTGKSGPVRIAWSSQSQGREILPAKRLFCTLEARTEPGKRPGPANVWVMGRGIMLRNGSFIAGSVRSVAESGVKFTYRGEKEYIVPLHQVARTVFRVSPRNALLSNADLASGALLGNGDFIEGQVQPGSGRTVKVSSVLLGLRSYNIENSDLAALVFSDPAPAPTTYQLRLADNSVIMARSVNVEQEQVSIVEPLIGPLQVPREAVTEIRTGRAPVHQRSATR